MWVNEKTGEVVLKADEDNWERKRRNSRLKNSTKARAIKDKHWASINKTTTVITATLTNTKKINFAITAKTVAKGNEIKRRVERVTVQETIAIYFIRGQVRKINSVYETKKYHRNDGFRNRVEGAQGQGWWVVCVKFGVEEGGFWECKEIHWY